MAYMKQIQRNHNTIIDKHISVKGKHKLITIEQHSLHTIKGCTYKISIRKVCIVGFAVNRVLFESPGAIIIPEVHINDDRLQLSSYAKQTMFRFPTQTTDHKPFNTIRSKLIHINLITSSKC